MSIPLASFGYYRLINFRKSLILFDIIVNNKDSLKINNLLFTVRATL